ncbi:DinB family protein [Roseiconus nitratireducens]|uniref:DinB family protein n=1 Tax=Roseiconus nitratireducens TaxID=2605748 RepID=A0A5M6CVX5_9BACT|nr:DinB family protein [Roseiconus nitratireducens]KAA5539096.1 DinB family protein [Roseiconus nitratireducens]
MLIARSFALQAALLTLLSSAVLAEPGDPLAIRCWPEGRFSVETQWGLSLLVTSDRHSADGQTAKEHLGTEQQATEQAADDHFPVTDQTVSVRQTLDHVLTRAANQEHPRWVAAGEGDVDDPHRLTVQSISSVSNRLLVGVDGVNVLFAVPETGREDSRSESGRLAKVDVAVLMTDGRREPTDESISSLLAATRPTMVVIPSNLSTLAMSAARTLRTDLIVNQDHNTIAVSDFERSREQPVVVILGENPWKMPERLAELFAAMDQACEQSQQVFAPLTAAQLNFRPANGTHTPRWNAEHMMGRQLLFFSQIYHQVDPSVPVMDLNPKQMPPDYVAAHPKWDGAEEARQMQRVSNFCRRFAYLLEGIEVQQKAPGSRWPSLQALLVQMQRHYQEHTANTVKKFDLPDWPPR